MSSDHTSGEGRSLERRGLRTKQVGGIRDEVATEVSREDEGHPDQEWLDELDQKRDAPAEEEQAVLNEDVGQPLAYSGGGTVWFRHGPSS